MKFISSVWVENKNLDQIQNWIVDNYPKSVWLISSQSKKYLGLVAVKQQYYSRIDFYSESAKTMFLLRFGNILRHHYPL